MATNTTTRNGQTPVTTGKTKKAARSTPAAPKKTVTRKRSTPANTSTPTYPGKIYDVQQILTISPFLRMYGLIIRNRMKPCMHRNMWFVWALAAKNGWSFRLMTVNGSLADLLPGTGGTTGPISNRAVINWLPA